VFAGQLARSVDRGGPREGGLRDGKRGRQPIDFGGRDVEEPLHPVLSACLKHIEGTFGIHAMVLEGAVDRVPDAQAGQVVHDVDVLGGLEAVVGHRHVALNK